ncbi:hypothetical protein [Chlorobium phaeobacteroides]|nr:hypothetical protein [Chlorobium phaeobacteroides]MBV5329262.1 hypothetical protein [Chlorobium sp.]
MVEARASSMHQVSKNRSQASICHKLQRLILLKKEGQKERKRYDASAITGALPVRTVPVKSRHSKKRTTD